jgi:hypothetical protein
MGGWSACGVAVPFEEIMRTALRDAYKRAKRCWDTVSRLIRRKRDSESNAVVCASL